MRLNLRTDKDRPLNLHLLFSPDDPKHVEEIERILSQLTFEFQQKKYPCSLEGFYNLGRAFDATQNNRLGAIRAGAKQFKVDFQDLRDLFRSEEWLRRNCLVAVPGSEEDGTSGLKGDDSFTATRREIEAFAKLILSSSAKRRPPLARQV